MKSMEEIKEELEVTIDQVGLRYTLECIAFICEAKAAHIEESYQDKQLASAWDTKAEMLHDLSGKEPLI